MSDLATIIPQLATDAATSNAPALAQRIAQYGAATMTIKLFCERDGQGRVTISTKVRTVATDKLDDELDAVTTDAEVERC
jgi:hypothetical protein